MQTIVEKIGEIESDADEHRYVLKTNASLVVKTLAEVYEREPERTCFRLVGGVLVERTVKDVLSTLQTTWTVYVQLTTSHQLTKVLLELVKQYKLKEKELLDFQRDIE